MRRLAIQLDELSVIDLYAETRLNAGDGREVDLVVSGAAR
jgi:hypothetical protein